MRFQKNENQKKFKKNEKYDISMENLEYESMKLYPMNSSLSSNREEIIQQLDVEEKCVIMINGFKSMTLQRSHIKPVTKVTRALNIQNMPISDIQSHLWDFFQKPDCIINLGKYIVQNIISKLNTLFIKKNIYILHLFY